MRLIQIVDNKLSEIAFVANPLESLIGISRNESLMVLKNILSLIVVLMDLYNNQFSSKLMLAKWDSLKQIISALPYSENKVRALLSDARNIQVNSNSVDLIITSPPYINVFNYHQKYRRSVEALGFDVLKIAKGEVGSNRKNRGNRFLTVIEYCLDMSLAIKEMIRISRPNARIILVVGRESNILSNAFSNSELIYKIASGVFSLPLVLKQQRVFKNKYGQMIFEDILHFTNNNTIFTHDYNVLLNDARQVAVSVLKEKLEELEVDNKNRHLLMLAISKANSIKPSEVIS